MRRKSSSSVNEWLRNAAARSSMCYMNTVRKIIATPLWFLACLLGLLCIILTDLFEEADDRLHDTAEWLIAWGRLEE